jgi:hypothetical protein
MDACAGERGVRLRVKGRRPFVAAMVTDSMGTGMFLPFTVLYFVHMRLRHGPWGPAARRRRHWLALIRPDAPGSC